MNQKRIVSIQDISCFGKCSLTVALPIISAMGVEAAIVPTAILSTHTGGFENYTFRDLSTDIPEIKNHWQSLDLHFDAIYTGYLGSAEQLELVADFIDQFKKDDNIVLVDPVLGDNGRLYAGFSEDFAKKMGGLCKKADIIVPNITEAVFMLGEEYPKSYDEEYIKSLIKRLCDLGVENVILTGVSYTPDTIGTVTYSAKEDEFYSYFTPRIDHMFHGTGDIFASVCAGALARKIPLKDASSLAVDYVFKCIEKTLGYEKEHWYGVRFEDALPYLFDRMKSIENF